MTQRKRAVFLDRDGTLNVAPPSGDFVTRSDDLVLLPGVAHALRRLSDAGYLLVVYSNQSCVARGLVSLEQLGLVNDRLRGLLAADGVVLDGLYFCPHWDDDHCACRKPQPGMLLRAGEELDIDLTASWAVGDSARDMMAGRAAGCRIVFVYGDAYPGQREKAEALGLDGCVSDVGAAADLILGDN